jgi:hypothetical protein
MAARAACDEHAACWSPRAGLSMRTATRTAATTHRTKEVPGPLLTEEHGKASAASSFLQANTNGVPVRGSVNCISVTQTLCQTQWSDETREARLPRMLPSRERREATGGDPHFSGPAGHPLSISVLTFVPAWMRRGSRSGEGQRRMRGTCTHTPALKRSASVSPRRAWCTLATKPYHETPRDN